MPNGVQGSEPSPYVELDRAAWAELGEHVQQPLSAEEITRLRGLGDQLDLDEVEQVYLPLSRLLSLYAVSVRDLHGAQERFLRGDRSRRALDWATRQLDERGGTVVIAARYVPGGRTAATFTAGLTHYPYARFAAFDAVAALSWAAYGSVLGYFGGRFFHDHAWAALLLAFGVAGAVTLSIEGVRRLRR